MESSGRPRLKGLRLNIHHRSLSLLVLTVEAFYRSSALYAINEDGNANVESLALNENETARKTDDILPLNPVLLVKEPFLQTTTCGGYGVRMDCVSDITFLAHDDARTPLQWLPRIIRIHKKAEDWKNEGNEAMKLRNACSAITSYELALQACDDQYECQGIACTIRCNRSQAYLNIGFFDAALKDAQFVLEDHNRGSVLPAIQWKSLFRAARALYGLQRFGESLANLERLLPLNPEHLGARKDLMKLALNETIRVKKRLQEHAHGNYDFPEMVGASNYTKPYLDYATYISHVQIRETKSRGRGLFLTKAVRAGELLLCEKAFSAIFETANTEDETTTINLNFDTKRITTGTQATLTAEVVQKLSRNPSVADPLLSLHSGSYSGAPMTMVDEKPVVDSVHIERIVALNSFGCHVSSRDQHVKHHDHRKLGSCSPTKIPSQEQVSTGLWTWASFINHECLPNAHRSFIGDMMIVRAACPMTVDTELTLSYVSPDHEYAKREANFKHWGFRCECSLCIADKETSPITLGDRNRRLIAAKATFDQLRIRPVPEILNSFSDQLEGIEKTYDQSPLQQPRIVISEPLLALAMKYHSENMFEAAEASILRLLRALGFDFAITASSFQVHTWGFIMEQTVEAFPVLWSTYGHTNPRLCAHVEEVARLVYEIWIGERGSFNDCYGVFRPKGLKEVLGRVSISQGQK